MERRMLEGIRALAEGRPISPVTDTLQLWAWAVTFALFIASGVLVLIGPRPARHLLGFGAAGVAFQIMTLIQPTPIVSLSLVLILGLMIWPLPRERKAAAKDLLEQES
jgi:hypothetical protein